MGLGVLVGLERRITERVSARALVTLFRGVFIADGMSICYPLPSGDCLPDAVFPSRFSTVELQAAIAPLLRVPVRFVVGGGISVSSDPQENRTRAPTLPLPARRESIWRAGLEAFLGSSSRAPRIQLSRTGFASRPFSLSYVDAVGIAIRF